jgi:hypothetical protein
VCTGAAGVWERAAAFPHFGGGGASEAAAAHRPEPAEAARRETSRPTMLAPQGPHDLHAPISRTQRYKKVNTGFYFFFLSPSFAVIFQFEKKVVNYFLFSKNLFLNFKYFFIAVMDFREFFNWYKSRVKGNSYAVRNCNNKMNVCPKIIFAIF